MTVGESLRRLVAERALYRCEYCLLHEPMHIHRTRLTTSSAASMVDRRSLKIEPLTPEGEATARLLNLNLDKRIVERRLLAEVDRYPG